VIVGVGIDVVGVQRFGASLARTPALAERLFTPAERVTPDGRPRTTESLAARFAAKEALAKAVGAPGSLEWHDAEITVGAAGRPILVVTGTIAAHAATLGIARWHVSLSHDNDVATAVVIAEGPPVTDGQPGGSRQDGL